MANSDSHNPDKTSLSGDITDDIVLPFQLEQASVNGRIVRLGPLIDQVLKGHDYPAPVSQLLGEAIALTALLGASIKFDGRLILQTKSDGPVDLIVVQYETPGSIRAYARFDEALLSSMMEKGDVSSDNIMGHGHLAMTIDQGADMERYQGIVALEGGSLTEAADTYFKQSEQLPTFLRLAVAKHYIGGREGTESQWHWRAGGLLIQDLTNEGGRQDEDADSDENDDSSASAERPLKDNQEDWNRVNYLAGTLEDHELLDPTLAPERLLYRLFHEEGVRVFESRDLEVLCSCTQRHIHSVLNNFSEDERKDMVESDGETIEVTCEFCSKTFQFQLEDFS